MNICACIYWRWLYDYVCLLWSELYLTAAGADRAPERSRSDGVAARARQLAARLIATASSRAD